MGNDQGDLIRRSFVPETLRELPGAFPSFELSIAIALIGDQTPTEIAKAALEDAIRRHA